MLSELIKKAIKESTPKYMSDRPRGEDGYKNIKEYLVELQPAIEKEELPENDFKEYNYFIAGPTSKFRIGSIGVTFAGEKYRLEIAVTKPDFRKASQGQAAISGIKISDEEYRKYHDILDEIAKQTGCCFRKMMEKSSHESYFHSRIINLGTDPSDPSTIKNIISIIVDTQKGSLACEKYIKEQQAYIRDTVKRLLE